MMNPNEEIAANALIHLHSNETKSNDQGVDQPIPDVPGVASSIPEAATAAAATRMSNDCSQHKKKKRQYRKKKLEPIHLFEVEPTIIQLVFKSKRFVNHTYNDYSCVPPERGYEVPKNIDSMSFSQKLHRLLSDERYSRFITWMPHGRAFRITVPKKLEEDALLKYFGHKCYSKLLSQLKTHGFKLITRGVDRNCHYHECFLKRLPHLCKYMPMYGVAPRRRLEPDPENEPDFYEISRSHPIKGIGEDIATPCSDIVVHHIAKQASHEQQEQHTFGLLPERASLPTVAMERSVTSKREQQYSSSPMSDNRGFQLETIDHHRPQIALMCNRFSPSVTNPYVRHSTDIVNALAQRRQTTFGSGESTSMVSHIDVQDILASRFPTTPASTFLTKNTPPQDMMNTSLLPSPPTSPDTGVSRVLGTEQSPGG